MKIQAGRHGFDISLMKPDNVGLYQQHVSSFQETFSTLSKLFYCDCSVFYIFDEKKGQLERVCDYRRPGYKGSIKLPSRIPLKDKQSPVAWVSRTKKPLTAVKKLGKKPKDKPYFSSNLLKNVFLPVISEKHLIGVLVVDNQMAREKFNGREEHFLNIFTGGLGRTLGGYSMLQQMAATLNMEKQQLEKANEQLSQHNVYLYALYEVNRLISHSGSTDEIFDIILKHAMRIAPGGSGVLTLIKGDGVEREIRATKDHSPALLRIVEKQIKTHGWIVRELDRTKAVYFNNQHPSEAYPGRKVSLIVAPFLLHNVRLGSIVIWHPKPNFFTPEHVDFLSALAGLAVNVFREREMVGALQVTRMEKERRIRELKSLSDLAKLFLTPSLPEETLLTEAVKAIRKGLDYDRVGLFLIDEDKGLLSGKMGLDNLGAVDKIYGLHFPLKPNYSVLVEVALGKLPFYFTEDYTRDTRVNKDLIPKFPSELKGFIVVPLKTKTKILGILCMDNLDTSRPLSEKDIPDCLTFASQVAIAMQNVILDKKREELSKINDQKVKQLSTLQQTIRRLGEPLNEEEVMRELYKGIREGLEIDRCQIYLINEKTKTCEGTAFGTDRLGKTTDLRGFQAPLESDKRIFGEIFRQEISHFYSKDVRTAPLYCDRFAFDPGVKETAVFPLKGKKKVIGLIAVDNLLSGKPLTRELLDSLSALIVDAAQALEHVRIYVTLKQSYFESIRAFSYAIDAKDHYNVGHSDKVGNIAVAIAKELQLSPQQREDIQYGAILHDVGKIGIDEKILNKPSRLDKEEYEVIKEHPALGVNIVRPIEALGHLLPIVRHHHEWYNGTGYPDRLKKEQIPLGARIVGVADAFDSMISDRPYRKSLGLTQAMAELKKFRSIQFDPQVVDALMKILQRHLSRHPGEELSLENLFS